MIIFQTKKVVENLDTNCVGVTGDNLSHTQEFYIKGICDSSLKYSIHLRFADGSVNTVVPDTVQCDEEGTSLHWLVKKNDIFMHGYFELQIEGRNDDGVVFQTEIVELYADESIPVEDKEYENPNSETLKLRDEAYKLMQDVSAQRTEIEQTSQMLNQYDLSKKLDNSEGSVKTENLANKSVTSEKIANGAVTSVKLAKSCISGMHIVEAQIRTEHVANGNVTEEKLSNELINKIYSKYDSSNIESGNGSFAIATSSLDKINSGSFEYQRVGNWVDIHVYIDFKAFTPGNSTVSMTLTGLPYVCKNAVTPREMCVTTNKKYMLWGVVSNTAGLTLLIFNNNAFIENEKLSFSLRYKIA